MVEPVLATTPHRRWLVIRYNFWVSTKCVTLPTATRYVAPFEETT
jgi:hypothetical protein